MILMMKHSFNYCSNYYGSSLFSFLFVFPYSLLDSIIITSTYSCLSSNAIGFAAICIIIITPLYCRFMQYSYYMHSVLFEIFFCPIIWFEYTRGSLCSSVFLSALYLLDLEIMNNRLAPKAFFRLSGKVSRD